MLDGAECTGIRLKWSLLSLLGSFCLGCAHLSYKAVDQWDALWFQFLLMESLEAAVVSSDTEALPALPGKGWRRQLTGEEGGKVWRVDLESPRGRVGTVTRCTGGVEGEGVSQPATPEPKP